MDSEKMIENFHEMWDAFPGMARLINSKHEILATNDIAAGRGFIQGAICGEIEVDSAPGEGSIFIVKMRTNA